MKNLGKFNLKILTEKFTGKNRERAESLMNNFDGWSLLLRFNLNIYESNQKFALRKFHENWEIIELTAT